MISLLSPKMGAETTIACFIHCSVFLVLLDGMALLSSIPFQIFCCFAVSRCCCVLLCCDVLCEFEVSSECFGSLPARHVSKVRCRFQRSLLLYRNTHERSVSLRPLLLFLLFYHKITHPAGKGAFFRNGARALVLSSAVVYGGAWMKRRGLTPAQLAGKDDRPACGP